MLHPMFATHSPRLRHIVEPDGAPAGGAAGSTPPAPPETGFPANTPVVEMDDKQQAAYWKHYARKHEATATSRVDYDAQKAKADRLDALEAASQTDNEKLIAAAKKEGESVGANRFLKDAVQGRLLALTGKTDDELAVALDLIDVTRLTQADGTLDVDKIKAFAVTLGTKAPAAPDVPPTDPVKAAWERQKNDPSYRGAGSIAELTKQRVAALTPVK